jgi:hypothetical protein
MDIRYSTPSWTTETPTTPGRYWHRLHADDQAFVVVYVEPEYDLVGPWGNGSDSLLSDTTGQWAGLKEPSPYIPIQGDTPIREEGSSLLPEEDH